MAAALILALLFGPELRAATAVTLEGNGVRAENGEICRFRAGHRENPIQRWLSSQQVTCAAAASPVAFPPGNWNVFARAGRAAISSTMLVEGTAPPATLSLTLRPAASVMPLLPAGHAGLIYAPRLGSAFPVDTASSRVLVPAGEELWLFVLEKSKPVAVVPVAALEAGAERVLDARHGGAPAVIAWLHVPESDRAALANARGVLPPHVTINSGGPAQASDPLPPFGVLNGAFVRLRDVSAGEAELQISGRGWLRDRRRVNVVSSVTLVEEPLLARPSAALIVNWSAANDLVRLNDSLGSCDAPQKPQDIEIAVSACPSPKEPREPVDPKECREMHRETFGPEMTFGTFTLDDIRPGTYRLELRFGNLPPVSNVVLAPALQQRVVRLNAAYIEIYGTLTVGGEPLHEEAVLKFPAGGYGFASRDTGEYRAVLLNMIGIDAPVDVAACDGTPAATVLADRQAPRNTRFDIDIPANELTIHVTDTFTREPLGGATIRYSVMSTRLPRRPLLTRTLTTGEGGSAGRLVIANVPDREIRLSVSHPGYQRQDLEPFSMSKTEKQTIEVQLVPLRGNQGRIVSQQPFDGAYVVWFMPAGNESERSELASDGTFVYSRSHSSDETFAVVSLSHPLWVTRAPDIGPRDAFTLRFPDGPVRAFEVTIRNADARDHRHIGLIVGGVRIPQPVLQQHQALRRLPATIRGAGPLQFRDIAETGSIDVALGPEDEEVTNRMRGMDFFALPQFAAAPRQRLMPGGTSVVFESK